MPPCACCSHEPSSAQDRDWSTSRPLPAELQTACVSVKNRIVRWAQSCDSGKCSKQGVKCIITKVNDAAVWQLQGAQLPYSQIQHLPGLATW